MGHILCEQCYYNHEEECSRNNSDYMSVFSEEECDDYYYEPVEDEEDEYEDEEKDFDSSYESLCDNCFYNNNEECDFNIEDYMHIPSDGSCDNYLYDDARYEEDDEEDDEL